MYIQPWGSASVDGTAQNRPTTGSLNRTLPRGRPARIKYLFGCTLTCLQGLLLHRTFSVVRNQL